MYLGDLDGDSFREHLVLAQGEGSQFGVFVSAWHTVGYDFDHDLMPLMSKRKGMQATVATVSPPFPSVITQNNLTIAMNALSQTWPSVSDACRIQIRQK